MQTHIIPTGKPQIESLRPKEDDGIHPLMRNTLKTITCGTDLHIAIWEAIQTKLIYHLWYMSYLVQYNATVDVQHAS